MVEWVVSTSARLELFDCWTQSDSSMTDLRARSNLKIICSIIMEVEVPRELQLPLELALVLHQGQSRLRTHVASFAFARA